MINFRTDSGKPERDGVFGYSLAVAACSTVGFFVASVLLACSTTPLTNATLRRRLFVSSQASSGRSAQPSGPQQLDRVRFAGIARAPQIFARGTGAPPWEKMLPRETKALGNSTCIVVAGQAMQASTANRAITPCLGATRLPERLVEMQLTALNGASRIRYNGSPSR